MKSEVLPGGTWRIVHIFTPVLKKRQDAGPWKAMNGEPLMAVRSSVGAYCRMRIYRRVDIEGPSKLVELEKPLPGTGGRGVAVMMTDAPLRVWYDDRAPETVDLAGKP